MSATLCGLEKMAVVLQLAASVHYAWATLYDIDAPHFDALDVLVKHKYVDVATILLEQLEPAAVTCPPVAAVTPLAVTAGGVTRPVDYFEIAKSSAQSEGARLLAFRGVDPRD